MFGAILGAVTGLIGAKKKKKQEQINLAEQRAAELAAWERQVAYQDPKAIRERAEAAGFNPLSFIGPVSAPGMGVSTSPVTGMGDAIATAGLTLADGLQNMQDRADKLEALAEQNAELRKTLNTMTLRPEVPGVYGTAQPMVVPSVRIGMEPLVSGMMGPTVENPGDAGFFALPDGTSNQRNIRVRLPQGGSMFITPAEADLYGVQEGDVVPSGTIQNDWVSIREAVSAAATDLGSFWDRSGGNERMKRGFVKTLAPLFQPASSHVWRMLGVDGESLTVPFGGNHLVPKDWWKEQ